MKTGISFAISTDHDTGNIRGRRQKNNPRNITYTYHGKFETYSLKVFETHKANNHIGYNLIIDGSLHKNYFLGKNYQRFTFSHLLSEIDHLCTSLFIEPENCKIQNLEIGVNIELPFEVKKYIDRALLLHSTTEFQKYKPDNLGYILGRHATHSQHSVKCYDKGTQNGLEYPLMRFEDRCIKMQYLSKYGIKTLKDLIYPKRLMPLENLLVGVWNDVLVYEPDIILSKLNITQKQKELLNSGQNRDHWERLHNENRKLFNKQRAKFRELMNLHSKTNTYNLIKEMIKKEWSELLKTGTNLPSIKYSSEIKGTNLQLR